MEKPVVEGYEGIPYSGSSASFEAAEKQTETEKKVSRHCSPKEQPKEKYTDKRKAQTPPEQMHPHAANKQRIRLREHNILLSR